MTFLMVSDDQARAIAESPSQVVFVDGRGRELGRLIPSAEAIKAPTLSDEEIAELRRRMKSPGPGKTTKELLDYLQSVAPIENA